MSDLEQRFVDFGHRIDVENLLARERDICRDPFFRIYSAISRFRTARTVVWSISIIGLVGLAAFLAGNPIAALPPWLSLVCIFPGVMWLGSRQRARELQVVREQLANAPAEIVEASEERRAQGKMLGYHDWRTLAPCLLTVAVCFGVAWSSRAEIMVSLVALAGSLIPLGICGWIVRGWRRPK